MPTNTGPVQPEDQIEQASGVPPGEGQDHRGDQHQQSGQVAAQRPVATVGVPGGPAPAANQDAGDEQANASSANSTAAAGGGRSGHRGTGPTALLVPVPLPQHGVEG